MVLNLHHKIPCYVLVYYDVPTIIKSLDFITKFFNHLDLHVIENPSKNTDKIGKIIRTYIDSNHIKSYYLFDKNISNNAVHAIVKNAVIKSEYVIFSDGDLIADETWLDESKKILQMYQDVGVVSTELSLHNLPIKSFPESLHWVPKPINIEQDYIVGSGGHHLLVMKTKYVKPLLNFIELNNMTWTDGTIRLFMSKIEKLWVKTKHSLATHLTWDLYADKNHEYTKLRLSKTVQETWEHNEWCGYKLTTKDFEAYYPPTIQIPTNQF